MLSLTEIIAALMEPQSVCQEITRGNNRCTECVQVFTPSQPPSGLKQDVKPELLVVACGCSLSFYCSHTHTHTVEEYGADLNLLL